MRKYTVAAIVLVIISNVFAAVFAQENDGDMNPALKVIHSRKSVRHFTDEKVTDKEIETILRAGMAAPSAANCQPWAFIIVTDRSLLGTLRKGLQYGKMLDQVSTAIVVCAIPAKASYRKTGFAIIDSSCAAENILLAAEALGLGAVWLAGYPVKSNMRTIRKTLGIPRKVIPVAVIPIGHPTNEDKPQDKFKKENIHLGNW